MSRTPKFVPAACATLGAFACIAAGLVAGTGAASAEAGSPMPVGSDQWGYIATHALTERAADLSLPEFVSSIPVPEEYKLANLAMAARFDIAVNEALASPGGCVQVVVDPAPGGGGVFSYGFFAVTGEYCQP